jgi:hypothetical protein
VKSPRLKTGVAPGLHLWAPGPQHNGSQTSRAAAERVEGKAPTLRLRVLGYLQQQHITGATHEEIATALQMRLDSVKARVHELGISGHVRGLAVTRPTSTGSPAMVFVAAESVSWCQLAHMQLADWPVTRESRWKQRAMQAEAELAALRAQIQSSGDRQ